jgi:4-carboxymuconolactone decarboxylase
MAQDSHKDSYDEGMKVRRRVLGDAWVDRSLANITPFNKDFQEFITRAAWGDVWTRPGLDRRMRSVGVLSTTIALGAWDEFRLHVRAAINNGLTHDEIKEVIIQSAIYSGVPKANHAFKEAGEVLKEIGAAKT